MDELKNLNLGKDGVKDSFIAEAKAMIAKYKRIRVKALKSSLESKNIKQLASEVAAKTNALIEDVRGHTFILKRR
jgi:RNA-binding protein YhbY